MVGVVPSQISPVLARYRLSSELRRLRYTAGMTATAVAKRTGEQVSTITRRERSEWREPDPITVQRLLEIYGELVEITESDWGALVDLAVAGAEEGWWDRYRDQITTPYRDYIGLESGASKIWTCDPQLIPALLQTIDYARLALMSRYPQLTGERSATMDEHMTILQRRQQLLTSDGSFEAHLVLDQTALHRPPADLSPENMHLQIQQIFVLAQRPNVIVQILPWAAGVSTAMHPFTILRFTHYADPEISWEETMHGAELSTEPDRVQRLETAWLDLLPRALPRSTSLEILDELAAHPDSSLDDPLWS